jgi:hypothetical protein
VCVCKSWHKKLLGLYAMYVMSEGLKLSFPSVCTLTVQVISKEQDEQRKGNKLSLMLSKIFIPCL